MPVLNTSHVPGKPAETDGRNYDSVFVCCQNCVKNVNGCRFIRFLQTDGTGGSSKASSLRSQWVMYWWFLWFFCLRESFSTCSAEFYLYACLENFMRLFQGVRGLMLQILKVGSFSIRYFIIKKT